MAFDPINSSNFLILGVQLVWGMSQTLMTPMVTVRAWLHLKNVKICLIFAADFIFEKNVGRKKCKKVFA